MRNDRAPREATPKPWTRPELVRLGRIEDVAGPNGTGSQGNGRS